MPDLDSDDATRIVVNVPTEPEVEDAATTELERQAREVMRTITESTGDLGARVRQTLARASSLWDEAHPGEPVPGRVAPEDDLWVRARARRWVERDFLVDPDLPQAMTVHGVERGAVWMVELRERGEARALADATEAYTGHQLAERGPVLPPWDYLFPIVPEIEAGERRERLAATEARGFCQRCAGSGHTPCARCEGRGFFPCPRCHGRARVPCKRCLGRGRIEDPVAARRAGAAKGYWQVQAERLASRAGDRLADLSEQLRQEYGVPLPPSAEWVSVFDRTTETIPCPDCVNGTTPCECGNGKRVCATCKGTGAAACAACGGTGSVVQFTQVIRRFDTRIARAVLPSDDTDEWVTKDMLRRVAGEEVWRSDGDALIGPRPSEVSPDVWALIGKMAADNARDETGGASTNNGAERRVIGREIIVSRVPTARVAYAFADVHYSFAIVGRSGAERFWADTFPLRWSRVGRFLRALRRDLQREGTSPDDTRRGSDGVRRLDEYRAQRDATLGLEDQ